MVTTMKTTRTAILTLAAFTTCAELSAQSTRNLIDFEDQGVGTPIFNQYPGVTFLGGDSTGSPLQVVQPALGTISGIKALRSQNLQCEFNCAVLTMAFDTGQHRVKMSTGLLQAATGGNLAAVLRAYSDLNGTNQVAQSA